MLLMPEPRAIPRAFQSERLLLRCPLPGDGAAVNVGILESLAELRPWMEWAEHPPTVSETEADQLAARADFLRGTRLRFLMIERAGGEFAGVTVLHTIDWSVPRFELGYWCCTSFTGQGYATEAVRAVTRFAFQHLAAERLEIRCDALNRPSTRVAERAGYLLDGTLRNGDLRMDGSLEDTRVYSTIRAQFERLQLPPIQLAAER